MLLFNTLVLESSIIHDFPVVALILMIFVPKFS
jgi:hypothetical protein